MAGEDVCDDFMWWYGNYFQSWHHSCDGDCYDAAAAADGDDDCSACSGGVTGFLWIFDVEIVASHNQPAALASGTLPWCD